MALIRALFLLTAIAVAGLAQQCPEAFLKHAQTIVGQGELSCEQVPGGGVKWTIFRPEVRQPQTDYPMIAFYPEDLVTIHADGCVHTGERGRSWKQYVDPSGKDSDRLYHGLIWIPGARIQNGVDQLITPVATSLVHISSVIGQEFVIQDIRGATEPFLRLGYEDDDYNDNEYPTAPPHAPRNRPGDSCDQLPDARVTIQISRGRGSDRKPLLHSFDPVSLEYDANGFQLAPKWYGNYQNAFDPDRKAHEQSLLLREASRDCNNFPYKNPLFVHNGVRSDCSSQASFDVPRTWTTCLLEPGLGKLHGHVNWAPATYTGKIKFEDFSPDKDLDFKLFDFKHADLASRFKDPTRPGFIGPILSRDSQTNAEYQDNIHVEIAGYETTEFFGPEQADDPFLGWQMFHYEYAKHPEAYSKEIQKRIDGHTAVMTGLLNLDCVHDCHTELHPVYAMAIRTRLENCVPGGQQNGCNSPDPREDDSWMIFVQNVGNEGSCSLDPHYANRDRLSVFLPAPKGAERNEPVIRDEEHAFQSSADDLHWTIEYQDSGVLVTFFLKPDSGVAPKSGAPIRINGVLHLNWMNDRKDSLPVVFDPPQASDSPQATKDSGHPRDTSRVTRGSAPAPSPESVASEYTLRQNATDFARERQRLWDLKKQKVSFSFGETIKMIFANYWRSNLGVFEEGLHTLPGEGLQLGPGARLELFQTVLGGVEFESAWGLHPTSPLSRDLRVKTGDMMLGLRVQITQRAGAFVEMKPGVLFRSASPGLAASPGFVHFKGHDAITYVGAGLEPFREKFRLTLRLSAGVMIVPGTGEKILRFTAGPQIQFRRRAE
jgi:hypothetical protein